MISPSTFAFVLVLVAAANGVAVWIIYARLTQAQASLRSTIGNALRSSITRADAFEKRASEQLRALEAQTPAKLAAEVAELSDAVARLAATQRRFAGKFHAELQHGARSNGEIKVGGSGGDDVDDEIAAHLALQSAPPRAPGT